MGKTLEIHLNRQKRDKEKNKTILVHFYKNVVSNNKSFIQSHSSLMITGICLDLNSITLTIVNVNITLYYAIRHKEQ